MQPARTIISPHRLARLMRWAQLWLQGLAAVLLAFLECDRAGLRQMLRETSIRIGQFAFLHVAQGVRPPRRKTWKPRVRRGGWRRALIGSRLRKLLRARDPVAHFFAILSVMRDFERHVRRLARRLARGLTRLRSIPPAREHDVSALLTRGHAFANAADTS